MNVYIEVRETTLTHLTICTRVKIKSTLSYNNFTYFMKKIQVHTKVIRHFYFVTVQIRLGSSISLS